MAKCTIVELLIPLVLIISDRTVLLAADFHISQQFSCDESRGNFWCTQSFKSTESGLLELTDQVGTALHREPVNVENVSLSITFSFEMRAALPGGGRGDGMTFVMFVDPSWVGGGGGALGAYDVNGHSGTQTLAVEFDTWNNPPNDPDDNHLGLDTYSVNSVRTKKLSDLGIWLINDLRYRLYVWIDYDHLTSELEIRVDRANVKPGEVLIRHKVNLFKLLGKQAYVGFTAAGGANAGTSVYNVYHLDLRSSGPSSQQQEVQPHINTTGDQVEQHPRKATIQDKLLLWGGICAAGVGTFFIILQGLHHFVMRRSWSSSLDSSTSDHDISEEDIEAIIDHPIRYSYEELDEATNSFCPDHQLGEGKDGHGFVQTYHGTLRNGTLVAIKRIEKPLPVSKPEVDALTSIKHRNIVPLLGLCQDKGRLLLVYDYMAHRSLEEALFCDDVCRCLSWSARHEVIVGVAAALEYLHEGCEEKLIHGDINCGNIMLDKNCVAKVGVFGLAHKIPHQSLTVDVNVGFLAPEVVASGRFMVKSDVYAFGAVVLEVSCGRKSLDRHRPNEPRVLSQWVEHCLCEGALLQAADERLGGRYEELEMEVALLLGLICTNPDPRARPTMRQVMEMLSGDYLMLSTSLFASPSSNLLPKIHLQSLLQSPLSIRAKDHEDDL